MGSLGGVEKFDAVWMTQNSEVADTTRFVVGQVKWFDAVKGFGFVVADEGGPDILLHANVLRNFGQGSVADASKVELRVQETDRGLQAVEVLSLTPPETDPNDTGIANVIADYDNVEMIPARVKWFDKGKGFGFANAYGSSEDIFLHVEVLRRCGLADLLAGEAVCVRVVDGERGQMAAEIHAWDHAINHN
ncbi:cold-shock DNA-binding protein family [Litoreibacter ascidiaceicola]|uniref:Cold-shock DNA-binding protein family n=2 Tax=Litoreibacter ascidiaceicola TaxID=1486859 RepID=A0A1M4W3U1_9RHOB|nr:cold-shock DNA-binding protein family [Litoreibacter ascidiaceicola]